MRPRTVCLMRGNLNPKRYTDTTRYPTEFDERGVYWDEISHLQLGKHPAPFLPKSWFSGKLFLMSKETTFW